MENRVQTERSIDKKNNAVHTYKTAVDFFAAPSLRAGINTLWHGSLPIDMLVSPLDSDSLIVVLNGATSPSVKLPWLAGVGVTRGMESSKLFISDPSLYLGHGLNSAYYSGSQFQPDLQRILIRIIQKVSHDTGARHIVFLGGSSGGFAALALSYYFPQSTAIVFNPQTNLWSHSPRPVEKWLSTAWGKQSLDQLPAEVNVDLIRLYSGGFDNRIAYMQNRTDSHYDMHFVPFLAGVGEGNLQYLIHDEAQGHTPPPKDMIRRVLEQALSTQPSDNVDGFAAR